ncbi:hypothetical protein LMH87_004752 [Akanthomyces muscarius]|uniref:Uncharacterized protein n=1 Tax=Akanthomyces muscarius TaxID=2231603 RepID=A0A9W8UHC1_AKAMU|nr:hypothetical protein LMH87_004752 [Akanthomyces muscarius]KAJ4145921.1 hypothetical protein LMH87_004752 [Akanthomyces muscarius]
MIQKTRAKLMLASQKYAQLWGDIIPVVLVVDSSIGGGGLQGTTNDVARATPKNAAYVIFTSGSTGQPKGCVIEHEQLCTSATHGGRAMGMDQRPRMLQIVSYAFDACIIEIIYTLIFGGMQVTSAFFTPSLFRNIELQDIGELHTVILGGESVPEDLINKWKTKLRLISAYGPTECAVAVTVLDYSSSEHGPGDLGKPFVGAWVVDQNDPNKRLAVDAVGELLVEGPTVGRGYLDEAAKTEKAFIPPPHWMQATGRQGRLYRTGDLVKFKKDGTLFFLGRKDNQVKIRGQRLEMGEVEHQLQKVFPSSTEVIVEAVAPTASSGSPILMAFLRMADNMGHLKWEQDSPCVMTSSSEQGLFRSLVTQATASLSLVLPTYAIPTFFIPVQSFPFSFSGKLDRKRLRNMAAELSVAELDSFTGETANRQLTALEQRLNQVEDVYPASTHQDYFAAPPNSYFLQCVFRLPPHMDAEKLITSWETVATENAILRTRLVQIAGGRNFQVVMKGKLEWKRETSLERFLDKDRASRIGYGDLITRFAIVDDESSGKRFFVWSGSHACYDGTAVPMLYGDLEHAFRNEMSPYQGLKFNQFIKHTVLADQTLAESFWRTYLAGSKSSRPTQLFCVVPESHNIVADVNLARKFSLRKTQTSEITISTMTEVAMALVFSRHLQSEEVVFSQYRTGRNVPLPGVEEMIAPAMTKIPHRFHVAADRNIRDLLYSSQHDLNAMAAFEHLGWDKIKSLSDDTMAACDAAIYVTVSAGSDYITNTWGEGIGMELLWTGIKMHSPFRFSVKSSEDGIRVNTTFDGSLLSAGLMDGILRQFEQAILQIVEGDSEQTVEDVHLDADWGEPSVLTPAVEAQSTEDLRLAVQKLGSPD